MSSADRDVSELAQVAKGQLAEAVDFVVADAVIDWCWAGRRLGFEPCVEDRDRRLPVQRAMWAAAVVVGAEGVELELELRERAGRWLLAQETLEGLMESLDLAAGLGVVGRGVFVLDPQALKLQFQKHLAA